ncbi:MAG: hypothetical protein HY270_17305 [Deltaproteobacteria bacterium]|nr:hypothetical protein [Deltaproteobacteria bacterium]
MTPRPACRRRCATILIIVVIAATCSIAPHISNAAPLLHLVDDGGRLGTVDIGKGTVAVIGSMGTVLTDIAFAPNGDLYGVDFGEFATSPLRSRLFQINPQTASLKVLGNTGVTGLNSLVFSSDGALYAAGPDASGGNGNLYTFDIVSGRATLVGSIGFAPSGDIAFDINGNLYMTTTNNFLVKIDRETGQGTFIGAIGFNDVFGLALAPNGLMYGYAGTQILSISLQSGAGAFVLDYRGHGLSTANGGSFSTEAKPPPPAATCPQIDLGSSQPIIVTGNTTANANNGTGASCGQGGDLAPDVSYKWTAPTSGIYVIDTVGSTFDTLLYVRDAACNGVELACNDDITQGTFQASRVSISLTAGQSIVIVVDGFGSKSGRYRLRISGGSCPQDDLGSGLRIGVSGSTVGQANNSGGASCGEGGTNAPEATFRWTAPASGTYVIDTVGSNFDTILYVRDATCSGVELACDDDSAGDQKSSVTLNLTAGQTVVIAVDGFRASAGDYSLHIFGTGTTHPSTKAPDDHTVLILDTTVAGGFSSVEATQAMNLGMNVELADGPSWGAKSSTDFATYRAIVLGDPKNVSDPSPVSAAVANESVWGRAITGNVFLIGSDPSDHVSSSSVAYNAISFAASEPARTGAYVTLSEYYGGGENGGGVPPQTPVPVLDAFGAFTVDGTAGALCYDNAHIVAIHPALSGLTDAELSNWSCSVHEAFDSWPANFQVLAIAKNLGSAFTASDGSVGTPYILARGAVASGLSLNPVSSRVRVGSSQALTATLVDAATGIPRADLPVGFQIVAGPNAGVAGSCSPANCRTDANGNVSFTYPSGTNAGKDTVLAFVDTIANNRPDTGEAQTTAAVVWFRQRLRYYALGDSVASGHGLTGGTGKKGNSCQRSPHSYPFIVADRLRTLPQYQVLFDTPIDLLKENPDSPSFSRVFSPEHHLACSGATSCISGSTANLATNFACRDSPAKAFPLLDLPYQVAQFRQSIRDLQPDELVLVSLTIGADDFDFKDELIFDGTNLCSPEDQFRRWADSTSLGLQSNLESALLRLLERPNVYVVLTDYFNPVNRNSAYFDILRFLAKARQDCDKLQSSSICDSCSNIGCALCPECCPWCNNLYCDVRDAGLAACNLFESKIQPNARCADLSDTNLIGGVMRALGPPPNNSPSSKLPSLEAAIDGARQAVIGRNPSLATRLRLVTMRQLFEGHESAEPNCGTSPPSASETYVQYPPQSILPGGSLLVHSLLSDGAAFGEYITFLLKLPTSGNDCFHPNSAPASGSPSGAQRYADGDGMVQGVFDAARKILP